MSPFLGQLVAKLSMTPDLSLSKLPSLRWGSWALRCGLWALLVAEHGLQGTWAVECLGSVLCDGMGTIF